MSQVSEEGLRRVIGVRTLAANAVNLTVGAGIFALPGVIASHLGAASFLAYILCAVLIGMVLLCFIEVGSKITVSGGAYAYIEKAFGPLAGFLSNTLFWFGYCIMADAAVANVFVDTLTIFWSPLQEPILRIFLMFLVFAGIALLNIRGVKEGATLVEVITVAKLIPLLVLIIVGIFFMDTRNLEIRTWPSIPTLGQVSLILFFAFGGVEASLNASGEITNPKKTIPRGILLGIFIVFILYVSIQIVAQGVLGDSLIRYVDSPLVVVAENLLGPAGSTLIVIGTAISCYGLISGDILTSSRLPFAAARDGLLPKFLTKIHTKYATPYIAIMMYASVGFILSVSGGFQQLAVMASSALLLMYFGVIAATLKLRNYKREEKSFAIPGGPIIPIIAMLTTFWFLSNLALKELLMVAGFLTFFAFVYFIMRFRKSNK